MIYIKRKRPKKHRQNKTKQNKTKQTSIRKRKQKRKEKLFKMSTTSKSNATLNATTPEKGVRVNVVNDLTRKWSAKVPVAVVASVDEQQANAREHHDDSDIVVGVPEFSDEDMEQLNDAMEVEVDELKKRGYNSDDDSDDSTITNVSSSKNTPPRKKQKVVANGAGNSNSKSNSDSNSMDLDGAEGGGAMKRKKQKKVIDPRTSYFVQLFGFYPIIAAAVFAVIKPLTEVKEKRTTEPESMFNLALQYLAQTLSGDDAAKISGWALGDDARFSEEDFKALELAEIDVNDECINWSAIVKNYMSYTMKVATSGDGDALKAFCQIKTRVESMATKFAYAKDNSKQLRLGDYFYKPFQTKNKAAEAELNNQFLGWLCAADTSKLFNPNPDKNIRVHSIGHSVLTTTANMYDTPLDSMDSLPILTGNAEALRDLLSNISLKKCKHEDGFVNQVCAHARKANVGIINACETIFNKIDVEEKEQFMQLISEHTRLKYEKRYSGQTIFTADLVVQDANGNLTLPERPAKKEGKRGSSAHICKAQLADNDAGLIKPAVRVKLDNLRDRMLDVEPSAQLAYLEKLWTFMQHFKLSSAQLTEKSHERLQDVIVAMQTCASVGKKTI